MEIDAKSDGDDTDGANVKCEIEPSFANLVPLPVTVVVDELPPDDDYEFDDVDIVELLNDDGVQDDDDVHASNDFKFLDKDAVISLLLSSESIETEIPKGPKVNKYFLLDDRKNFHNGKRWIGSNTFSFDKIPGWGKTSLKKHCYLNIHGKYKFIGCSGGAYHIPQALSHEFRDPPREEDLIIVRKQYGTIRGKLKRRVCYIEQFPKGIEPKQRSLILVEYLSDFNSPMLPSLQPGQTTNLKFDSMKPSSLEETAEETELFESIEYTQEVSELTELAFDHSISELNVLVEPDMSQEYQYNMDGETDDNREKMGIDNGGVFLDKDSAIDLLLTAETSLTEIPPGLKENEYFVIDNQENDIRAKEGKRRVYVDDCGVWKNVSMKKLYYAKVEGRYMRVETNLNGYSISKVAFKGRKVPRIQKSQVMGVIRVNALLRRNENYKRHISWIFDFPEGIVAKQKHIALVEYTGKYPTHTLPHGNRKNPGASAYVRTPLHVMKLMKEKVATKMPKEVLAEFPDIEFSPRNLKQLQNLRYRCNMKVGAGAAKDKSHMNEVTEILNMVHSHSFIQKAVFTKGKSPLVIAYTNQQMNTLRLHCNEKTGNERIVGIDSTIAIGPANLTILLQCHPNLLCRKNLMPAIMVGPMLLHMDSSLETYVSFFSSLKCCLCLSENTDINRISIASKVENEKLIVEALLKFFPAIDVTYCKANLENDMINFLRSVVELDEAHVETITAEITSQLMSCTDENEFGRKVLDLRSKYRAVSQLTGYFDTWTDKIKRILWRPYMEGKQRLEWCTDNCVALGAITPLAGKSDKLNLREILDRTYDIAKAQERDEIRALYDEGSYVLAPHAKKYEISYPEWLAKTSKQKNRITEGLRKHITVRNPAKRKMDLGTFEEHHSFYTLEKIS